MKQQRTRKFSSGGPLSWILFFNLKDLHHDELKRVLNSGSSRNKFHGFSERCLTAFPLAVAIWEALLNEHFTSDLVSDFYRGNLLFDVIDQAEKWDIKTKTLMYPKFLFGKTFNNSLSVFSDFNDIVQIRNNIVHYKHSFYEGPDKAIANLRQKKVSYPKPKDMDCP